MTMILTSIFRTQAVAARFALGRPLSTTCTQTLGRLNDILENYRTSHYAQELPRRFRKEIVNAASKKSSPLLTSASPGIISAEGIEHVLNNIGAGDQLSHDEIETILREVCSSNNGDGNCVISAEQMLDLISNRAV
eukprot:35171_1